MVGDLWLSCPLSGHGGARIRDGRVPVDFRADSNSTVTPTLPKSYDRQGSSARRWMMMTSLLSNFVSLIRRQHSHAIFYLQRSTVKRLAF
ncbi:hypothetical protein PoB_000173300 [Plakobranchus ocellatus]|uniref:Uncharacterized protein n=1 Tax=Plakobranchus ocellatus TaxID=259542 RepID=A0AAV3XXY5_9GAST|nr:hypothetical protein PoB_000173300 [Plakobranchus ocellatus]